MAHTFRTVGNIDNGKHGVIEVLVAVHDYTEDQDAIVLRSYNTERSEAAENAEVWISTTALHEVASALEDNRPQQLTLFDVESL